MQELSSERAVVLATLSCQGSWNAVAALAARLNRNAPAHLSPCAIPAAIDADGVAPLTHEVRLFGLPFEVSDVPALLALSMDATIFPVFAAKSSLWCQQVWVDEPIRPRGGSVLDLQRTSQRIAWAVERHLRKTPSALPPVGWPASGRRLPANTSAPVLSLCQ